MSIQRHSPLAHAAYHDLLSALRDEVVAELRGTPTRVERNRRIYWYDSFRIGSEVHKRYIGEDSAALRERLDKAAALKANAKDQQPHRARLIRLLRAEGFMGVDAATGSLLAAFAKSGLFRLGGTLVGTQAFRLYEGELGLRYPVDATAQTTDIDIASLERLSVALEDAVTPPTLDVLAGFDFVPVPSLEPAKVWRWRQNSGARLVEFLTPSFQDEEGIVDLPALGVKAQALPTLNYLIAEPIMAALTYRNGVLVQVPRPERFALHKLIVAQRRSGHDRQKARKDLAQARFLLTALLDDRPDDAAQAYEDAMANGPQWQKQLEGSLATMPAVAERLNSVAER